MAMHKVAIVCGGRDYNDKDYAFCFLNENLPECLVLIEGGATGADRLGRLWAQSRGIHVATVNAQWGRYGKAAGPYRNVAMLRLRPDVVVAFPGGNGTNHMRDAARRDGIQLIIASGVQDA